MHIKWGALGEVFLVGHSRGAGPATAMVVLCFGICFLVVAYGIYLIVG
jgi:hypothetical protein